MPRVILAIRDPDQPDLPDHVSLHDSEPDARAALAAYVRRQPPRRDRHPVDDEAAITAWFNGQPARYIIGEVTASPPAAGEPS